MAFTNVVYQWLLPILHNLKSNNCKGQKNKQTKNFRHSHSETRLHAMKCKSVAENKKEVRLEGESEKRIDKAERVGMEKRNK